MATQGHSTSSNLTSGNRTPSTRRNVAPDRAVTSIAASRIAKGARLPVPIDLALRLSERKQAEIL
jgi:hypothetical protein